MTADADSVRRRRRGPFNQLTKSYYVRELHLLPQFRYLIGTRPELAPVWQDFNVLVEERNPEHIRHGAFEYLLDARGVPRLSYPVYVERGELVHDLRLLLR
jgi:cytochrome oxidase Cu insertion factor (SCO1/SenC/PrrC family)